MRNMKLGRLAAFGAALSLMGTVAIAAPAPPPEKPKGGAYVIPASAGSLETLVVPGYLAYSNPDRDTLDISPEAGVANWNDRATTVVWYGKITTPGDLHPTVSVRLPAGATSTLRLTVTPNTEGAVPLGSSVRQITGAGDTTDAVATFAPVVIPTAGYVKFTLTGETKSGATFGNVQKLALTGDAVKAAEFAFGTRRNAISVHFGYPGVENLAPVNAFYNEVTARKDPTASYYCAIGWNKGYFGYQVNSATERRVIFSVWDAGNEAIDPNKVAADDRVQLLAKGPDVDAGRFGNEGTGGHSHLVYPWKTGETYRFLVTSKMDGPTHAIYTGYFYFPEKQAWGLIASFRAPLVQKPNGPAPSADLHGLYSFDEDFWGNNGDQRRQAEFGNAWARTVDGSWHEITEARFTHTDRAFLPRDDFDAFPTPGRNSFTLETAGFVPSRGAIKYGDILRRKATGKAPGDLDAVFTNPPAGVTSVASGK